jgi:adenosylcobalamin-dependent ribonucleoside-triphosphate reductase
MILSPDFLEPYQRQTPHWGPIGEVTFNIFYSRLKDSGHKESWVDSLARVCQGTYDIQKWHCEMNDRPWNEAKAVRNAQTMFDLMYHFKFTPPGRGLWAMGTEAMWKHGAGVLNNCGFFSTKTMNVKPFTLLMHFSMLGVGCGIDTLGAGTRVLQQPGSGEIAHKVHDSREGWVDSVEALLSAYFYGQPVPVFDYSGVRGKGALLKTFGGVASGPAPLIKLHEWIRNLCEAHVGKPISSTFITDLANYIGKCTEAGNIRRSAEIVLGEYGDTDFYDLKNDIAMVISHRSMSNNSVKCIPGCDYRDIVKRMLISGDPGIFWLWNAQRYGRMNGIMNPSDMFADGTNPCVEQTLWDRELCNLVETYMARHANLHQYMRTLKFSYLYAKIVTLMKTGFKETDAIIEQNRRIGCSQSGIIRAFNIHGRANVLDWSDKGYDFLTGLDADYSCWLGVNRSIKRTSIKPSGTVPLLCGETGALNYPISEYYHRTIRVDHKNPILERLDAAGHRIEVDATNSDTMVVYFPVHEPNFVKGEADVSMWEQLENAAAMQKVWCDNQVSCTIKYSEEEAKDIPTALELYENRLKAVSFQKKSSDFHPQAPYQAINETMYAVELQKLKPVDLTNLKVEAVAATGCDGGKCEV